MNLEFDSPKNRASIIKVIGVGGGGSNAVNHMFSKGIEGVDFIVCNTDEQALELSVVPNKVQLGPGKTSGLGAGNNPEVGRVATIESIEDIKQILSNNTKMVFITAGMGGGTGTGGAPEIAKIANDLGILTVGIVTTPFKFEGKKRMNQAMLGIDDLRENVDTLVIISNDKLREVYGDLKLAEAFSKADDVLTTAAKGIAEIITKPGLINVDFQDVNTVMRKGGVAIMGIGVAEGEQRAIEAVKNAINSPLLNENTVNGAKNILLNVTSGTNEVTMDEIGIITEFVQENAGNEGDIIWGSCIDTNLGDKISVTLIATGFDQDSQTEISKQKSARVVHKLEETPKIETEPIQATRQAEPTTTTFVPDTTPTIVEQKQPVEEKITYHVLEEEKQNEEPDPIREMVEADKQELEREFTFEIEDTNQIELNFNSEMHQRELDRKAKEEFKQEMAENMHLFKKDEKAVNKSEKDNVENEEMTMMRRTIELKKRLRNLSFKLQGKRDIEELEKTPAYKRREIELKDAIPSDESHHSDYQVDLDEDNASKLNKGNSYIHDLPD